jgi:hypothetical protein
MSNLIILIYSGRGGVKFMKHLKGRERKQERVGNLCLLTIGMATHKSDLRRSISLLSHDVQTFGF